MGGHKRTILKGDRRVRGDAQGKAGQGFRVACGSRRLAKKMMKIAR